MEVTQLPDLETKTFDWKAIPKKYIIAGCIALAIIILIVVFYNVGKKKTNANHAKPNIKDADFEEIPEEKETEDLEEKILHFLGKEDYSENDIIQLDIDGKLHWTEACTALGIGKTAYFRHKAKYKQNG